jgi:flagellar export protein FliJ
VRRFQFTLHAVALVRERQKQVAMESHANALARRRQAAAELEYIEDSIRRAEQEWRQRMQGGVFRAVDATQARQHVGQLQEFRRHRAQVLARADEALQHAAKVMHQAHQACEVMDKLREHQREEHRLAGDREERRVLDELASTATSPGRVSIERSAIHD